MYSSFEAIIPEKTIYFNMEHLAISLHFNKGVYINMPTSKEKYVIEKKKTPEKIKFGNAFKSALQKLDYTQEQFSKEFGASIETIRNYCQGISFPTVGALIEICDFLNKNDKGIHFDIDYLLGNIECSNHDREFISTHTGLTETGITRFENIINSKDNISINAISTLNKLLDMNDFWVLLTRMHSVLNAKSELDTMNNMIADQFEHTRDLDVSEYKAKQQFDILLDSFVKNNIVDSDN